MAFSCFSWDYFFGPIDWAWNNLGSVQTCIRHLSIPFSLMQHFFIFLKSYGYFCLLPQCFVAVDKSFHYLCSRWCLEILNTIRRSRTSNETAQCCSFPFLTLNHIQSRLKNSKIVSIFWEVGRRRGFPFFICEICESLCESGPIWGPGLNFIP